MNPIYRNIISLDWMTLVLGLSLLLLTVGKYFYKSAFFNFIILPFNNKYIALNKKKDKLTEGFHLIMSLFQIVNLALFFIVAKNIFDQQPIAHQGPLYPFVALGILLFLLLKALLQLGTAYFFENQDFIAELMFEKFSYFNYGGLIAFFGNLLLIYVFPGHSMVAYLVILLLLAINIVGFMKTLRGHQKPIMAKTFYFILYICTLEISPIAIVISYLNS